MVDRPRRSGLGKRLNEILSEVEGDSALRYPAYEGLFSKTPTGPDVPSYSGDEYDEYERWEGATEDSSPKEETPSFSSVLKEAKLLDTYFDKHIVGGEESGGGRDSSSRVAAFMYCLPAGTLATQTAIVDAYLSLKRDGYAASELLNEFEASLYVQWRRGSTRSSTGYVSSFSGVTINDFIDFYNSSSLGGWIEGTAGSSTFASKSTLTVYKKYQKAEGMLKAGMEKTNKAEIREATEFMSRYTKITEFPS